MTQKRLLWRHVVNRFISKCIHIQQYLNSKLHQNYFLQERTKIYKIYSLFSLKTRAATHYTGAFLILWPDFCFHFYAMAIYCLLLPWPQHVSSPKSTNHEATQLCNKKVMRSCNLNPKSISKFVFQFFYLKIIQKLKKYIFPYTESKILLQKI